MRSVLRSRCWTVCGAAVAITLIGCQSSGIARRKAGRIETYNSLTADSRALIDKGEIQAGMDTNAVFIAWGEPGEVRSVDSPDEPEVVWFYYKHFTREHPRWVQRYERYGFYGTYDYRPEMTSHNYLARTVVFKGGRAVRWQNFPPPGY